MFAQNKQKQKKIIKICKKRNEKISLKKHSRKKYNFSNFQFSKTFLSIKTKHLSTQIPNKQ